MTSSHIPTRRFPRPRWRPLWSVPTLASIIFLLRRPSSCVPAPAESLPCLSRVGGCGDLGGVPAAGRQVRADGGGPATAGGLVLMLGAVSSYFNEPLDDVLGLCTTRALC